jgi:conjugal transfer pilin signal peptidase TrbI
MQNLSNRKQVVFKVLYGAFLVLSVTAMILVLAGRIAITLTPSLRYTFFYLDEFATDKVKDGSYVLFKMDNEITRKYKINRVIKEVACTSGDTLMVMENNYFCNGAFLGRALHFSLSSGSSVTHFIFNGTVPSDSIFVMGHNDDSYDSRYFGFIKIDSVKKMAHPIF